VMGLFLIEEDDGVVEEEMQGGLSGMSLVLFLDVVEEGIGIGGDAVHVCGVVASGTLFTVAGEADGEVEEVEDEVDSAGVGDEAEGEVERAGKTKLFLLALSANDLERGTLFSSGEVEAVGEDARIFTKRSSSKRLLLLTSSCSMALLTASVMLGAGQG